MPSGARHEVPDACFKIPSENPETDKGKKYLDKIVMVRTGTYLNRGFVVNALGTGLVQ